MVKKELGKTREEVNEKIENLPEKPKKVLEKLKEFWESKDGEAKKRIASKIVIGAALLGASIPLTGGLSLVELTGKVIGIMAVDKLSSR